MKARDSLMVNIRRLYAKSVYGAYNLTMRLQGAEGAKDLTQARNRLKALKNDRSTRPCYCHTRRQGGGLDASLNDFEEEHA